MKIIKSLFLSIFATALLPLIIIGCSSLGEQVDKTSADLNNYELEFKNGSRIFQSEAAPASEAEIVILESLKVEISDEYDKFGKLYVDSERFNDYPKIYKENFSRGQYTDKIIVKSLIKLSSTEYTDNSNAVKYYPYLERLKEYDPFAFEVIEANYTAKYNEEKNKNVQFGDGDLTRYYVVVRHDSKSGWKIFDIYGQMENNGAKSAQKLIDEYLEKIHMDYEDLNLSYNGDYGIKFGYLYGDGNPSKIVYSKDEFIKTSKEVLNNIYKQTQKIKEYLIESEATDFKTEFLGILDRQYEITAEETRLITKYGPWWDITYKHGTDISVDEVFKRYYKNEDAKQLVAKKEQFDKDKSIFIEKYNLDNKFLNLGVLY